MVMLSLLFPPEEAVCPLPPVGAVLLGGLVLVSPFLESVEVVVGLPPF